MAKQFCIKIGPFWVISSKFQENGTFLAFDGCFSA
jgi:hypothetical protein